MAYVKRNVNYISKLQIDNMWMEEKEAIKHHVVNFYMDLYRNPRIQRPKLDGMEFRRISKEQRAWLDRPFTEEDVKGVVWSIKDEKSRVKTTSQWHSLKLVEK